MSDRIIGNCSLCGGAVTVPAIWHGVIPPTPTCSKCGAVAKQRGPTIEMERPTKPHVSTTDTADIGDLLKKVRDV
jgi:hypothetical protein